MRKWFDGLDGNYFHEIESEEDISNRVPESTVDLEVDNLDLRSFDFLQSSLY